MQQKVDHVWRTRAQNTDATTTRFHPEQLAYDVKLLQPYLTSNVHVLDLGCGHGLLGQEILAQHAVYIHAVDREPEIVSCIQISDRLTSEVADVRTYRSKQKFDLVLLFGVINSIIDADERCALYKRCAEWLKPDGKLIIKSQFGVKEDVVVDKYSEELKADYCAIYPALAAEQQLLEEWYDVTVTDPYPPEFNPWPNTHFYAFVASPRASLS